MKFISFCKRLKRLFLRKKYVRHPECPDFIPDREDEKEYQRVPEEELNDLLDAQSSTWDELLTQPHVLENNRARLEYVYSKSLPH